MTQVVTILMATEILVYKSEVIEVRGRFSSSLSHQVSYSGCRRRQVKKSSRSSWIA